MNSMATVERILQGRAARRQAMRKYSVSLTVNPHDGCSGTEEVYCELFAINGEEAVQLAKKEVMPPNGFATIDVRRVTLVGLQAA